MKIKGVRGELYVHILEKDRKLGYRDGRTVEVGKELKASKNGYRYNYPLERIPNTPMMCNYGMHASRTMSQAAHNCFNDGVCDGWVCIVRLNDHIKHGSYNYNKSTCKSVALRRKVIGMRRIRSIEHAWKLANLTDEQLYHWVMSGPQPKKGK